MKGLRKTTGTMTCHVCQQATVIQLQNFGFLPLCNRFLPKPTECESTFPLILGQCVECGLVQLGQPVRVNEIRPQFSWLTYNEPEGHLDSLVDSLLTLPGLSHDSSVCGISFKDDSTLERFRSQGFQHLWRLHPKNDLDIDDSCFAVETIQDRLTETRMQAIREQHGTPNLLIIRHILEHAHQLDRFLNAIRCLCSAGSYVVFEVPDCSKALSNLDYTTIWEEHVFYFTPHTFHMSLARAGFKVLKHFAAPYQLEDSLIAITKVEDHPSPHFSTRQMLSNERLSAKRFAERFHHQRRELQHAVASLSERYGSLAILGAGHLSMMFLNLYGLSEYFKFVVDDNPHKQELLMPGSQLPIHSSKALRDNAIGLCVLGVPSDIESSVIDKVRTNTGFQGEFVSIFPQSSRSIHQYIQMFEERCAS